MRSKKGPAVRIEKKDAENGLKQTRSTRHQESGVTTEVMMTANDLNAGWLTDLCHDIVNKLERNYLKMMRLICGVKLTDRMTSEQQ